MKFSLALFRLQTGDRNPRRKEFSRAAYSGHTRPRARANSRRDLINSLLTVIRRSAVHGGARGVRKAMLAKDA